MINLANDYSYTAAPEIFAGLAETADQALSSYGTDAVSESARRLIRTAAKKPNAEVRFLVGGTKTNAFALDILLPLYAGVVAAETAHIAMHEAGAVEFTGHKVITLPSHAGKIHADDLTEYLEAFRTDPNRKLLAQPGAVYISYPTERGTLYSTAELRTISSICHKNDLLLYVDGARMAYGLAAHTSDASLPDLPLIAELCDAFCIGGAKCGAMFGESLVIPDPANAPAQFTAALRQHGALLAKGWLVGQQFKTLFTNDLYRHYGQLGVDRAAEVTRIVTDHGLELAVPVQTNQVFVRISDSAKNRLAQKVSFADWKHENDGTNIIRFVTSWATTDDDLSEFEQILAATI